MAIVKALPWAGALLLCLSHSWPVSAAPVVGTVRLVTSNGVAAQPQPDAQTFTISQAGNYTVSLKDLQIPNALGSLELAIATPKGTSLVLSSAASQTVKLSAGTYTAQVLAQAAPGAAGGTFSAEIKPAAGGSDVWQYESTVGPANGATSTGTTAVTRKFSVAAAGSYQLVVTDLAFPVALSALNVIILNDCGTVPGCVTAPVPPTPVTAPTTGTTVALAAGDYDLFVVAKADPAALQGLLAVQIGGAGSAIPLFATTVPVGTLPAPLNVSLPTAVNVALNAVDLSVPSPLASLKTVVLQQGALLASLATPTSAAFPASAGELQVYALGTAGASGQGAAELIVGTAAGSLADVVVPVTAPGAYAYAYAPSLATAGSYQLTVHDFAVPSAFSSLRAAAAQGGTLLTSTAGTGTFAAAKGPLNVLVFPVLGSAADSQGLFNVRVAQQGSGQVAFQTAQGVGASYRSSSFTVSKAGSYDLNLVDLAFPAPLSTLAVILTNGDSLSAEVFGTSTASFDAQSGVSYTISTLASAGTAANYGLLGLSVDATPAPPTVTLTASASSVVSGGNVTLTWSSSNATSCTASGSWQGNLPTAGTRSVGPLTSAATYSISCSGASTAPPASTSVTISVSPKPSSVVGGGGGMTLFELAWLGLLALQRAGIRVTLKNPIVFLRRE